eukprot:CAMPEP_0203752022 /NCGR_PEP_ID=MMETSP0098-20131031/6008_1 /ASSEMBLY_ACC=CAM_ASM_000208 /TAXON_ID=96639 /ORGANISM=" , Strain NY0313808BC1" /LENGTH=65 /DNA_ID=CAMNT_0050642003 /DNA_START=298 /DNA_END=492 /DNA_ORIENTATION=-
MKRRCQSQGIISPERRGLRKRLMENQPPSLVHDEQIMQHDHQFTTDQYVNIGTLLQTIQQPAQDT